MKNNNNDGRTQTGGSLYGQELMPLIKAAGRTDRFSENLWKWVRKYRDRPLFVAFSEKDGRTYDEAKTLASRLYIGFHRLDDGWLHGSRLIEILCNGAAAESWAYQPAMQFREIPGWWDKYIEHGKCFIDPEHYLYLDNARWIVEGDVRTCIWCGKYQQREHIEMVPQREWKSIRT